MFFIWYMHVSFFFQKEKKNVNERILQVIHFYLEETFSWEGLNQIKSMGISFCLILCACVKNKEKDREINAKTSVLTLRAGLLQV